MSWIKHFILLGSPLITLKQDGGVPAVSVLRTLPKNVPETPKLSDDGWWRQQGTNKEKSTQNQLNSNSTQLQHYSNPYHLNSKSTPTQHNSNWTELQLTPTQFNSTQIQHNSNTTQTQLKLISTPTELKSNSTPTQTQLQLHTTLTLLQSWYNRYG